MKKDDDKDTEIIAITGDFYLPPQDIKINWPSEDEIRRASNLTTMTRQKYFIEGVAWLKAWIEKSIK